MVFSENMDKTMSFRNCFDKSGDSDESESKRRKSVEAIHFDRMRTYTFSCSYCHRKYHSAQALGGHQNAHKRERADTLAALRSFDQYHKHHHNSNQRRHNNYAFSTMSSSSLFSSLLPPIDRTSSGILVHSVIEKPASSSKLPSSSRGSSHLYVNHKQYPLQQAALLSDYACKMTNQSEGANNCLAVGSSLKPTDEGTEMLDLSLKL